MTGLVLEESPERVKVIADPLAKSPPLVLGREAIAARTKPPASIMPKGLLDHLSREEILDLIACVASRGNPKHAPFREGHEHGHGPGR